MGNCPAFFGDGLTGQIHDGIRSGEGLNQLRGLPRNRFRGIQLQPHESSIGAFCLVAPRQASAHQRELMIRLQQGWDQLTANKASAAKQQQTHGA